jgi:hypothetical protein
MSAVARGRRFWTVVAAAAAGAVAVVGLAVVIVVGGIRPGTPSADDRTSATPSATASTSPTATATASAFLVKRLKRHGILVFPPDQEPTITYQEAVRLAHKDFRAKVVHPLVQLFRVTVTDLGRPDPTQPYGRDLRIEDRLAWMFAYRTQTQGLHDSSGVDYGGPYGQSIVLIDARTGRFLMGRFVY